VEMAVIALEGDREYQTVLRQIEERRKGALQKITEEFAVPDNAGSEDL